MTDTVDKVIIQSEVQGASQTASDLNKVSGAMDGVTVASSSIEKSTTSLEGKFASLERRFQTTAGQQAQFAKIQKEVNLAVAQNPALQERANELLVQVGTRYGVVAQEADKLAHAHEGLTTQSQSLFHAFRGASEQIALGVSPAQALTAQMNHLTYAASGEGGLLGAFGQIAGKIGGAATSAAAFVIPAIAASAAMGAISTVAIAAGVHWASAQTDIEKSLKGIGRQSGATAADINQISEATASTTGLSIGQSREIATAYAAVGKIAKDNLGPATAATEGLAEALGVDTTKAAKLMAAALADPAKGVDELNSKVGGFNLQMKEMIEAALRNGDVQQAQALLIRGVAQATQDAADKNSLWAASFKAVKDGFNLVGKDVVQGFELARHDLGGAGPTTGVSKQSQLATAQADLSKLQQGGAQAFTFNPDSTDIKNFETRVAAATEQVNKLKNAIANDDIANWAAQLDKSASAADNATKSMIPQIDKIRQMEEAVKALTLAQNVDLGASGTKGSDQADALVAAQNQLKVLQDTKVEAAAYNQNVKAITDSYSELDTKAALLHATIGDQLVVIQAVGAEAKRLAQYQADYNAEWLKTGNEMQAATLAQDNYAKSQAASLSAIDQQIKALKDSTDLIKAQASGNEKNVAAAQAYEKALEATGDPAKALELSTAVSENYTAKMAASIAKAGSSAGGLASSLQQAAQASIQAATAWENAARSAANAIDGMQRGASGDAAAFSFPNVKDANGGGGSGYTSTGLAGTLLTANIGGGATHAADGGINPAVALVMQQNAKIDALKNTPSYWSNLVTQQTNATLGSGGSIQSAIDAAQGQKAPAGGQDGLISSVQSLYDLLNKQTTDKSQQAANLNQELSWLKDLPKTFATESKIADLNSSIKSLTDATVANTEALSPYYAQDPRTSHIGFRAGFDRGGAFVVPGAVSSNDNMVAHIPVASGERVMIEPPGTTRGGGSSMLDGKGGGQPIQVIQNITFNGNVNRDEVGRTMFQAGQNLAKQVAGANR